MYQRSYELLSKKFNQFLIPTILISMTINVITVVDALVVGNFLGPLSLATMVLITPIFAMSAAIYLLYGLGGSTLISIAKAERDEKKANQIFTTSILLLILTGIIIAIIGFLFIMDITNLFTPDPILRGLFKNYGLVILLGSPFCLTVLGIPFLMRADNQPNLASLIVVVANILNIVIEIFLIVYFKMSIIASAYSFVIGCMFSLILIAKYFSLDERTLYFDREGLNLKKFVELTKEICSSGISAASFQFLMLLKSFLLNMILSLLIGAVGLTVYGVCYQCICLSFIIVSGIAQSMSPLVSTFYKEKDSSAVKYTFKRSLKMLIIPLIIYIALIEIFPVQILGIFGVHNPSTISMGITAIRLFAFSIILVGINFLLIYYTQAIQENKLSLFISISEGLLLIPIALVLYKVMGINGIWLAFLVTELITLIITYIAIKRILNKSQGKLKTLFMLENEKNEDVLEYSLDMDNSEVVDLSEKVIEFCNEKGLNKKTSVLIGLTIEEMSVNTIEFNEKSNEKMDILIKIQKNQVILSFKDSGKEFNPVAYVPTEETNFGNIAVLQKIADDISYANVLGINSTIITINR